MDTQLIIEALENHGVIPDNKYFDNPTIQERTFNFVYSPDKNTIAFDKLSFQVKGQANYTNIRDRGNLTIHLNDGHGAVNISRGASDSPSMKKIHSELKDRGISIQELYKQFYLIKESDKFTEEEKSVLLHRNYTDETKIIKYEIQNSANGFVKELYLIKDLGDYYKHHHIIAFMTDQTYYDDYSVFYNQKDVVMVIEPLDGRDDAAEEIVQSIQTGRGW
ncbi:hypothetical protein [Neisseria sp. Ec49-e6-T10]|uniref:hypothetical protein n=1 Tax=Neisseria sp. Ec49-e6-T10 TaxID=3140744 RepID=UPI003EB74356